MASLKLRGMLLRSCSGAAAGGFRRSLSAVGPFDDAESKPLRGVCRWEADQPSVSVAVFSRRAKLSDGSDEGIGQGST